MTTWADEDLRQNVPFTSETFVFQNPDGSPTDFTGATASLKARYGRSETATIALSLDQTSGVTLGGINGTAFYAVTAAQALAMTPGEISYDLIITTATNDKRQVSGVWRLGASAA